MTKGRIPRITAYAKTDLILFKVAPFSGFPTTEGAPAEDFFANIPSPVILTGDGRVTKNAWLPASAARAPGVKPATYVDHGISGAWQFADGQEEYIHMNLMVPDDMDLSEESVLCLGWSSTTTSQDCDWEIAYLITAIDGDTSAAADDTVQSYEESSSVAEGLVRSGICAIEGGAIGATDVCLHIQIMRDGNDGSDNLGAAAEVHGVVLSYVANKIGT